MSDLTVSKPSITVTERVRRIFKLNGTELADPNPGMTPEEVRKMYAASGYPMLTNASITGPTIQGSTHVFEFKAAVGTKG
jgi:PRTRC genetic system protein C